MNALTPVNPAWKPNHRFTYPVVIINANGTLIALDNVGCWQILTQHFDDSWEAASARTKRESEHAARSKQCPPCMGCALHTLGTPLPPWREKQKPLLPPLLKEDRQYRRVHNGASEGTVPLENLEMSERTEIILLL